MRQVNCAFKFIADSILWGKIAADEFCATHQTLTVMRNFLIQFESYSNHAACALHVLINL